MDGYFRGNYFLILTAILFIMSREHPQTLRLPEDSLFLIWPRDEIVVLLLTREPSGLCFLTSANAVITSVSATALGENLSIFLIWVLWLPVERKKRSKANLEAGTNNTFGRSRAFFFLMVNDFQVLKSALEEQFAWVALKIPPLCLSELVWSYLNPSVKWINDVRNKLRASAEKTKRPKTYKWRKKKSIHIQIHTGA